MSTTDTNPQGGDAYALAESFKRSVSRIADHLRPATNIRLLSHVTLDFFDCTVADLGVVIESPYANEIVEQQCHHCETMIQCKRIVAPFVACQPCIERHERELKLAQYKRYWEHVCPERFRDTDVTHQDFPRAIYAGLKKDNTDAGKSFFLIGPSRRGKTRVAMKLLKRALLRDQHVGVLWPEKIAGLKSDFNDLGTFDRYAEYDVLLFDDTLLSACRNARHMDAVKQLLDVRMRHNRPSIFTSQIGETGVASGKEFGELKEADLARIDALIKRLREECKVVSFAEATPAAGEAPF